MASPKTSIPKGTRDFGPNEMAKRKYIFNTIENVFQLYGYQPIETPAMENLSTLMGKYGEEGDRLIFKILNSGDYLKKVDDAELHEKNTIRLSNKICEKALRYDLTVPFARFVVQHQSEITFPFKRYQIQNVWRADRPQKGRYREFYQCDVDVVGSNSLLNEVELVQIIDKVFKKLRINTVTKINNRKILTGIAEIIGEADKIVDITVAIDKLDKIGIEKVNIELESKGLSKEKINKLQPIINLEGSTKEKIAALRNVLTTSEIGIKGLDEVEEIFNFFDDMNLSTQVELDLTLARGLNYYTGAIFEVKAADFAIGSICGGGRYDDLTGIFGLPNTSGVGVSFGADRIYDVLSGMNLFPEDASVSTTIFFVNFGEKEARYCLKLVNQLRGNGIKAELFPDSSKMKKQMTYANNKNIPFVALVGENEMNEERITLKDMKSGEQNKYTLDEIIDQLK